MIYLNAFLFSGLVCLIAQIILDNSKLTAGHITSLFAVIGAILAYLDIYPWLIEKCGAGATILIMNFGNMLFQGGIEGFNKLGILGIFSNLLTKSSLALVSTIIFSFIFSVIFKAKD